MDFNPPGDESPGGGPTPHQSPPRHQDPVPIYRERVLNDVEKKALEEMSGQALRFDGPPPPLPKPSPHGGDPLRAKIHRTRILVEDVVRLVVFTIGGIMFILHVAGFGHMSISDLFAALASPLQEDTSSREVGTAAPATNGKHDGEGAQPPDHERPKRSIPPNRAEVHRPGNLPPGHCAP